MARLPDVLRYRPEGRGFDPRWCHCRNPSGRTMALGSTQPLTEMSTTNISFGCKGGRSVGLTNLTPLCADCREIWEPQTPGTLRACPGVYRDCFTFECRVGGSLWPCGLRRRSAAARLLRSRVRTPPRELIFFSRLYCVSCRQRPLRTAGKSFRGVLLAAYVSNCVRSRNLNNERA